MIMLVLTVLTLVVSTQTASNYQFLRYLNTSVDPCDDFYQFSCGNFAKYHHRPENQNLLDLFTLTGDQLVLVGHEILASKKRQNDHQALKKIKSAYQACVDVENFTNFFHPFELQVIEEFGGMPLISSNEGPLDWRKIANLIATTGVHQIFNFRIANFDPEDYLLVLYPDSAEDINLIRPKYTKSYDEVLTESFKKKGKKGSLVAEWDALDQFLWNVSKYIVEKSDVYYRLDSEIMKDIQEARQFLSQLVNGGIVDDEEILPLGSEVTIKELQEWTKSQFGEEIQIDWLDYINQVFEWAGIELTESTKILNMATEVLYGPLNLIRKTDSKIVKNALLLRSFVYLAPDSDSRVRQAFESFVTSIDQQYYPRWEYCTRKILDTVDSVGLSFAVTYDYQRHHYDATKIRKAVLLIQNLRQAHRQILLDSDWIDPESRGHLLKKVDNMAVELAYPDFVNSKRLVDEFYENVRICEWDSYGNARRIRAFRQAYALTKYTEKGNFWGYPPLATNAYAIKPHNQILIPISILQEGFFTGDDPVVDYSRLGTTIAHEMTHHFDPDGLNYNENGYQLDDFLTNQTQTNIDERAQCLTDQYSGYLVPEINGTVDGTKTLNENFADNGGIRKSFLAFQKLAKNNRFSKKYTNEQLFFIAYATMWCSQEKPSWLEDLVKHNAHAPSRIRVLGVLSNFDEFSKAFQCLPGNKMNPEKKCVVW